MGESTGIVITEKIAKLIVRKYGKRKDHLTVEDCINVSRRQSAGRSTSKSPKK
jgi:ribosome maturation factor RimP